MPRIHFRDMGTASVNRKFPPFTANRGSSLAGGTSVSWAPRSFTIEEFTATAPVAPGVGTAVEWQMNQGGTVPTDDIGSPVSLSGTNTSVRGSMGAGVSIVGTRETTQYSADERLTGSPTSQGTHNGLSYTCSGTDTDVSIYSWQSSATGTIFGGGSPSYLKPCSNRFSATLTDQLKIIWPETGTFKYFAFVRQDAGQNWDGNIDFVLQIDGGSSISFTPTNGVAVFTDYLQTLAVTSGQYVYWQAVRNSGALNPTVALVWGFGT